MEIELQIIPPANAALKKLVVTGSKTHYAALQEHARAKGFLLSPDALRDAAGTELKLDSEDEIYRALNLDPLPAPLREDGLALQPLDSTPRRPTVRRADFRGIIHNHTTASDGRNSLREMANAMCERGFEYLGIADHSKAAAYANGLTPERVRAQWREIDELNRELAPFQILKGTECDILADGKLDFDDELLAQFDFVVASIHSGFSMTADEATARLCRALENPHVDILGHPTGRLLLERRGSPIHHEQVIECAARHGKAIELNANPHRLDLDWRWLKLCTELNVLVPINPDAHDVAGLDDIQYGIETAQKGPLPAALCPSTWSADELREWCNLHGAKR
jgi:DNA polymerase (family 10)